MRASPLMTSTWDRLNMKRSGCTLSESLLHPSLSRSSMDITPGWGDMFAPCAVTLESNVKWNHVYASETGWKGGFNSHKLCSLCSLSICLSSSLLGLSRGMWMTVNFERGKKKKKSKQGAHSFLMFAIEAVLCGMRVFWLDETFNEMLSFKRVPVLSHAELCYHELCGEIHSYKTGLSEASPWLFHHHHQHCAQP